MNKGMSGKQKSIWIGFIIFCMTATCSIILWLHSPNDYRIFFFLMIMPCVNFWILRYKDIIAPDVIFPLALVFFYGFGFAYLNYRSIPLSEYYLLSIIISAYSFCLFSLFADGLYNRSYRAITMSFKFLQLRDSRRIIYAGIFVSSISSLYVYARLGVPIFAENAYEVRLVGFSSVSHYVMYLMRSISIFALVLTSYELYVFKKISRTTKILLILGVLITLSTSGRADVMTFLILQIIAFHHFKKRFSLPVILITSISLLLFVIGYNYLRMFRAGGYHETLAFLNSVSSSELDQFIFHFFAQISLSGLLLNDVMTNIPINVPHFQGHVGLITISTFLPGNQDTVGDILKEAFGYNFTGGQVNLSMLGDFYADFGLYGCFLYSGLLGFASTILYRSSRWSHRVLYVYVSFCLFYGIPTGLISQAIRFYFLVILIGAIYLFPERRAKSENTNC